MSAEKWLNQRLREFEKSLPKDPKERERIFQSLLPDNWYKTHVYDPTPDFNS